MSLVPHVTVSLSPPWSPDMACPCGADTATLGTRSPKALEVLPLPTSSLISLLLLSEGHDLLLSSRCSSFCQKCPPSPSLPPSFPTSLLPSLPAHTHHLKLPDPHPPPSKPVDFPSLCPSSLLLSCLAGANKPYQLLWHNEYLDLDGSNQQGLPFACKSTVAAPAVSVDRGWTHRGSCGQELYSVSLLHRESPMLSGLKQHPFVSSGFCSSEAGHGAAGSSAQGLPRLH